MPVNRIAPQIPLEIDEERGKYKEYAMTDLTKVVDQNIKMVLLTSPGERIMNPNFGVGMRKYLLKIKQQLIEERNLSRLYVKTLYLNFQHMFLILVYKNLTLVALHMKIC